MRNRTCVPMDAEFFRLPPEDAASRVSILDLLRAPSFYELHQTAQGYSRWAFGDPRLLLFHPGGAGYVEVDAGRVFGKFFQEHGGGDGSAPASAGIHHVGDVRFDDLFVFVVEGKTPHLLTGLLGGFREALVQRVVAGEDSGVHVAEGHDYRAGQSRGVDQMGAAELTGVAEAVG